MTSSRRLSRLNRLSGILHHLVRSLPDEDDLRSYMLSHPDQNLWDVASLWTPVLLRGMRRRGYGDDLSLESIEAYLNEVRGEARGGRCRNLGDEKLDLPLQEAREAVPKTLTSPS